VDTPATLATNVNGFNVMLSCRPNTDFDAEAIQAQWTSAQPIDSVGFYSSSFTAGGSPSSGSATGPQILDPLAFAISDGLDVNTTSDMFTQGFVVANSGGVGSQPETGFWYSLSMTFQFTSENVGHCSVTGMLVPVAGSRLAPITVINPVLP
jgi:hypothetical protein